MGNLRNCRRCGALYVYNGNPLCTKCIQEDEELYKKVREYIEEHPRSTTFEVSQALDVPVEKIFQFLREGKLELSSENVNMLLVCESCGKPIKSGRYCTECSLEMEQKLLGKSFRKDRSTGMSRSTGMGRSTGMSGSTGTGKGSEQKSKNQMFTVERRKKR